MSAPPSAVNGSEGDARKQQIGALVAALAELFATPPASPVRPDMLVAYPFGFEKRAATALVRRGDLKAVRIGRKMYAKASSLVALIDALPPVMPSALGGAAAEDPERAYRAMVEAAPRKGRR